MNAPLTPSPAPDLLHRLGRWIRAVHQRVRVARTVHALPFAAIGAVLALDSRPTLGLVTLLVFCVVFARATLVALVRLFAAPLDVANPGIPGRAPTDPPPVAIWSMFAIHGAAVLVFCAYLLNDLSGHLSWLLLGAMLAYALLRRFTALSHLLLGVALAAAPLGTWIAIRGELPSDWLGFGFLCAGIVTWVAGFDMVYGLHLRTHGGGEAGHFERPLAVPPGTVFRIARALHALTVLLYLLAGPGFGLSPLWYAGPLLVAALLLAAHRAVGEDLDRSGSTRFRTLNLATGPALLIAVLLSR